MKSGIYRIKNIITGDCYVGSSVNIERRWKTHQRHLTNNKHANPKLQASYNKYGVDAFIYNVLDYCENILEREQMFLDTGAFKFNICLIAAKPPTIFGRTHMIGKKHSEETKAKMSAAAKGNVKGQGRLGFRHSEEAIAKMSAAKKGKRSYQLGRKASDETKAKMSAAAKGRKHTEETKAKMSEAAKKRKNK